MYAFLLLLGAVITAAGLGLVASGVSIQDHTFDATNVLPAMIAVIGGCILIGLSFVVRALQRVERALMVRPMPRPARLGEHRRCRTTDDPAERTGSHSVSTQAEGGSPFCSRFPWQRGRHRRSAGRRSPSRRQSPSWWKRATSRCCQKRLFGSMTRAATSITACPVAPMAPRQVKTAPRFTVAVRPARKPQQQPEDSDLQYTLAEGASLRVRHRKSTSRLPCK